jgi:hypothetical protein
MTEVTWDNFNDVLPLVIDNIRAADFIGEYLVILLFLQSDPQPDHDDDRCCC